MHGQVAHFGQKPNPKSPLYAKLAFDLRNNDVVMHNQHFSVNR
jgi:hypothetical protein